MLPNALDAEDQVVVIKLLDMPVKDCLLNGSPMMDYMRDPVGRNPNMAGFPDPSENGRVGHPAFPTLLKP